MELMRGLAFIALLFAGSAVGAELRQAEVCGDGTTHQSGYCPAVLSSASCSATGATTGSCSATSDEADGTRYVCATSNNTALTGAEIEACSGGAAIAGSSAAETGSNSVSLSGLTTDAAHYGQIVNKSPEQWYSNRLVPSGFTPSSSGVPYDLSAYSIPFSYSWPTAPTITSEATVTPATLAANNVNGRRLTLTAGSYGDVSPGDDQEWILQAGAEIDNFSFAGSHRVKVRGETPRVGRIGVLIGAPEGGGSGTTDILFDGIYQSNGTWTTSAGEASNAPAGHRIAVVNSSLNTASYTIFLGATVANDFNNLIVAGNYIRNDNSIPVSTSVSAQHAVRIMSVNTFIFADNYIEKFDTGIIWRVHTNSVTPSVDSFDGFIGGNVLVRAGGTIFSGFQIYPASSAYTPGDIYDLTFHDNEIHQGTGGGFAFDMDTWNANITNVTITNNFSNGSDGLFNVASTFPSFTISGNTSQSYNAGDIPTAASVLGWTP